MTATAGFGSIHGYFRTGHDDGKVDTRGQVFSSSEYRPAEYVAL
jgi:hypothetical protein